MQSVSENRGRVFAVNARAETRRPETTCIFSWNITVSRTEGICRIQEDENVTRKMKLHRRGVREFRFRLFGENTRGEAVERLGERKETEI